MTRRAGRLAKRGHMPEPEHVAIDVTGLELAEAPGGRPVRLGEFGGVQILVLLRHRH